MRMPFHAEPCAPLTGSTLMQSTRKLWRWLAIMFFASFAVLGWLGREIYLSAPPIPKQVVTTDGRVIFTGEQIQRGQEAWLQAGGQQLGTVWGHGSYVAPDWSADWLHREALGYRDLMAQSHYGRPYENLDAAAKGSADALMKSTMRGNTYDAATG